MAVELLYSSLEVFLDVLALVFGGSSSDLIATPWPLRRDAVETWKPEFLHAAAGLISAARGPLSAWRASKFTRCPSLSSSKRSPPRNSLL
jgi:hypothetical protein